MSDHESSGFLPQEERNDANITEPSPQKVVAVVYVNLTTGLVSEDFGAFYWIGIVYGRGLHMRVRHYARIRKVGQDKQSKARET